MRMVKYSTLITCGLLLSLSSHNPVHAQFGPELFSLSAPLEFASIRTAGMGNIRSVVVDPYSANPAHAAWLDKPEGNVFYANFDFDGGVNVDYEMLRYESPVKFTRWKDGLQLVYYNLDSSRGGLVPTGPPLGFPVQTQMEDAGIYVGYGVFVSDRTAIGIASAFHSAEARAYAPLPPPGGPMTQVAESKSDSILTLRPRLSIQHKLNDQWDIGGIVTMSSQSAKVTGIPGFVSPDSEDHFKQMDYDLGVAYHPNEKAVLAAEWVKRKLTSDSSVAPLDYKDFGINLGGEYKVNAKWDIRAGSFEGNPTVGFSYHGDGWRVEYAFISGYESDDLGPILGDADMHAINVMKEF